jgi:hypothetical protein
MSIMKKFISFLVVAVISITFTYGKKIDLNTAQTVAYQFMTKKAVLAKLVNIRSLHLAYTSVPANTKKSSSGVSLVNYYVFNLNATKGFVIISGDDIVEPILGYSNQGSFDPDHIPSHVASWLKGYDDQIQFAVEHQMQPTAKIKADWELYKTINSYPIYKSGQAVSPLVQTTWNQSPYYNDMCPYDNTAAELTVTGCVATAMAQVLKYWNSPTQGAGFNSYNDPKYGTQSADFGSTTYDWTNMPLILNGANTAIATLMYHCGVSVNMTYGIAETGGSSAYVVSSQSPVTNCAEYALKTYFGYPTTLSGKVRQDFDDVTWKNMLTTDLNANRPVIYAGFGSGGGHCFVCDGYDNNGLFHFNWGWQGMYDGYFDLNALNPEGVGTGGGTGGFNSGQQAIFGIDGSNGGGGGGGGNQTYGLALYSSLNISSTSVNYGNPFTVSTNIANFGPGSFQGTVCAAIFDTSFGFVDFVDSMTNVTFDSGYYYSTTFNYPGKFTLLPGTYYIATYYRANGGNWMLVGNYQTYTNFLQMAVVNSNSIEMYANMVVTPGMTMTTGQQVSVHLDVANDGSTDFNGTFDVSLYDMDGYPVSTIQQLTGMNLPAGDHYTNGLTFITTSLVAPAGTYLMALQYLPNGGSNWNLTGSTYYKNPIFVLVKEADLTADQYEPNDNASQAYNLTVNFNGNDASVTTPGANCNTGTDYDFYKINLAQGFSYTISARVDDASHNANLGNYTLNAIWIDSVVGSQRSPVYTGAAPDFSLVNGGTVIFGVAPEFTGLTGTYNLVVDIKKNPAGIAENSMNSIKVFPNPANDNINIDFSTLQQYPSQIKITTVEGREMLNYDPGQKQDKITIPVGNLSDGVYILQVVTMDGVFSRKIIIRK